MRPLQNQVLILQAERTKQIGSLLIATSAQEDDFTGTVIATGPGKTSKDGSVVIPMTVVAGDVVTFQPGAGVGIQHNGQRHLLVTEDHILAVM